MVNVRYPPSFCYWQRLASGLSPHGEYGRWPSSGCLLAAWMAPSPRPIGCCLRLGRMQITPALNNWRKLNEVCHCRWRDRNKSTACTLKDRGTGVIATDCAGFYTTHAGSRPLWYLSASGWRLLADPHRFVVPDAYRPVVKWTATDKQL